MRKFYKQVIRVEILVEDAPYQPMALDDVVYEITEGGSSGTVTWEDPIELDGPGAAKALMEQGSDPGFFRLDEDGNDLS